MLWMFSKALEKQQAVLAFMESMDVSDLRK